MKFLLKVKKHQYYLYISTFLIIMFFLSNIVINKKVTGITQNLITNVIQENTNSTRYIFKLEFNELAHFITNANTIIKSSNKHTLKKKLFANTKLTTTNKTIDNSFILFLNNKIITDSLFITKNNTEYIKNTIDKKLFLKNTKEKVILDTVISLKNVVYNRKVLSYQLTNNQKIIFGYDVNLLEYWNHFSENYFSGGGYPIITNSLGVCLFHPEKKYIGKQINTLFDQITLPKILNKYENKNHIKFESQFKINTTSEYLKLKVFRYFNTINTQNGKLILVMSYPIDIFIKESVSNVTQHFLLVSLLALCTFLLILGTSRIQQRKEFLKSLAFEKESKKLAISNEQYQKKNAILQLNQLRKKMNPHFLFNSLNSLLVLIDVNQDLSQQFVLKLAEVYRYLLEERKENLVTLQKELQFLEKYFFLHKIRFKKSLSLDINYRYTKDPLHKKIPFLALETLVENAIKHNEITKQKPLFIEIIIKNNFLIVSNNYNPRKINNNNSYNIGLNYLKNCYQFYYISSFKTEVDDNKFICTLPLLP